MRRPSRTSVVLALAIAASLIEAGWLTAKPRSAVQTDLSGVPTEDLIGRFQSVSKQSIGADTMVLAEGFIALDTPLHFRGGVLGVSAPAISPVMRELVRRGVAAVPALLDHLSDRRPTKLIVGDSGFFTAKWYGDEYDPKDSARTELPSGLKRTGKAFSGEGRDFTTYQLTVGDLCFVTLGQVVNRKLLAVRYQPSQCLVVNSPVQSPTLAAAVQSDWKGLTSDEFRQFLIDDTQRIDDESSLVGGLQRLLFYFPDEGLELAERFLNRPVHNSEPENSFVTRQLLKANDEAEQEQLLSSFRARYGEQDYSVLAQDLVFIADATLPDLDDTKEVRELTQQRTNANRIVARHFAGVNKHPQSVELDSTPYFQQEIVDAVASFPSADIDQTVRALLKRTLALCPNNSGDKLSQCWLASACMQRLLAPKLRKIIAKESDQLNKNMPQNRASAATERAYIARCERFLQTWMRKTPLEQSAAAVR